MIIREIIHLLQFVALLAAQILVFNHIHLLDYATPLLYVCFLLHFPYNYSKTGILIWAFLLGLSVDIFSNTPGVAAGSMTLTALLQPILLHYMAPKDSTEDMMPNFSTMGYYNYMRFFTILIIIHHIAAFMLESFTYCDIVYTSLTCGSSIILTTLIVWAIEHLTNRKS